MFVVVCVFPFFFFFWWRWYENTLFDCLPISIVLFIFAGTLFHLFYQFCHLLFCQLMSQSVVVVNVGGGGGDSV